jgi:hypothetical protein
MPIQDSIQGIQVAKLHLMVDGIVKFLLATLLLCSTGATAATAATAATNRDYYEVLEG